MFIVFEGIDNSGKSTLSKRFVDYLNLPETKEKVSKFYSDPDDSFVAEVGDFRKLRAGKVIVQCLDLPLIGAHGQVGFQVQEIILRSIPRLNHFPESIQYVRTRRKDQAVVGNTAHHHVVG